MLEANAGTDLEFLRPKEHARLVDSAGIYIVVACFDGTMGSFYIFFHVAQVRTFALPKIVFGFEGY